MRRLSLNARTVHDARASDVHDVVLVRIDHPDLDEPVRLSTDPTERLSVEPLAYGTRSTWMADGEPGVQATYAFILLDAVVPGDPDDALHHAQLAIELHDNATGAVLRQTTDQARVDMAIVLSSSPDLAEAEFLDLRLVSVEGDAGEVRLSISRAPLADEPATAPRFTRARFPGLYP